MKENENRVGDLTETLSIVRYVAEKFIWQEENESNVQAEWSPAELMSMLASAPDPFARPRAFQEWLRTTCIVYDLRPVRVRMLLRLVYGSKWEKVKGHFFLREAHVNDDWPDTDAMTTWLDGSCTNSIDEVALENVS